MTSNAPALAAGWRRDSRRFPAALGLGAAACLAVAILGLCVGASPISPWRVPTILWTTFFGSGAAATDREAFIIAGLRLPRIVLGLEIGAGLAVAGALMQGLFRNPLADPGLIGVSSGAGLAVAATIVLGEKVFGAASLLVPFVALPVNAFLGGLVATLLIYAIATRQGRTSMAVMLLAGVALASFTGAMTGLLSYLSDDRQLRDLSFWFLGSLGGANWARTAIVSAILLPAFLALPFLGRGLNALAFGDAEAFHLGIRAERVKAATILCVALIVGASVAAAGAIGFVGIVAPHLVRLTTGADHRTLLPLSALCGATLLVGADALARTMLAPAELPVGILTASIGAPFFLWLLLRSQIWSEQG